tara:strand:+ start:17450 stop:17725 length:276 start_codon:yes stop_codon:yes gene_type:complete
MRQKKLKRAVAHILKDSKEQGELGLTVGQIRDRLMNGGFKHLPSGRQLGGILKGTDGFYASDKICFYDKDLNGSVTLNLWTIDWMEAQTWM